MHTLSEETGERKRKRDITWTKSWYVLMGNCVICLTKSQLIKMKNATHGNKSDEKKEWKEEETTYLVVQKSAMGPSGRIKSEFSWWSKKT